MARKIEVEIIGDTSKLEKSFKSAQVSARGFNSALNVSLRSVLKIGAAVAALDLGSKALRAGISEFSEQQKVAAQTEAAIRSTGAAANVTASEIDALALSLSNLSGIDDELTKSGENVLLSFTQIRNAAGKGNDIFNQATKAAVDFAVRTGRNVPAAAQILGKALADPARRVAALARAGVVFSGSQIKALAAIQKTSGVLAAQKFVLAELEKRFGGAAKAAGETLPGQLNIIRERARDLAGEIIGSLAPAFTKIITSLTGFVKRLSEAKTLKAKFNIVVEGIAGLGRQILSQISDELRSIDFGQVVDEVSRRLGVALRRIGEAVNSVDFGEVGRRVGDGIVSGLRSLSQFLESVDWGFVGKRVADGIGDALRNVNWKAVITSVGNFIVASFKAFAVFFAAVGKEFAKALGDALIEGLRKLGEEAEKLAIRVVLKIIEPFDVKVFGHSIVPGLDALIGSLKDKLKEMEEVASTGAAKVAKAVEKAAGSVNRSAAVPTRQQPARTTTTPRKPTTPQGSTARTGITAAQRNTFFDNAIRRQLERVNALKALTGGLNDLQKAAVENNAALQQIAGLKKIREEITARIKQTKDKTRRLTLQDEVFNINQQIAGLDDQIKQSLKDRADAIQDSLSQVGPKFDLAEAKADATKSLADNLKVYVRELSKLTRNLGKATSDATRAAIQAAINAINDKIQGVSEDFKSKALAVLNRTQENLTTKNALEDARRALAQARVLGGKETIRLAQRQLDAAVIDRQKFLVEGSTVRAGTGGFTVIVNGMTLNGVTNVDKFLEELRRKSKQSVGTTSGRNPAAKGLN